MISYCSQKKLLYTFFFTYTGKKNLNNAVSHNSFKTLAASPNSKYFLYENPLSFFMDYFCSSDKPLIQYWAIFSRIPELDWARFKRYLNTGYFPKFQEKITLMPISTFSFGSSVIYTTISETLPLTKAIGKNPHYIYRKHF